MERGNLTDHTQISRGSSTSTDVRKDNWIPNVNWAMTLLKEYRYMGFYVDARGCYVNTNCANEDLIHNYIDIKNKRVNNNMVSYSR